MKLLSLLCLLPGLLATNVEQRTIEIHEHGTTYISTFTFDFDRKVQIIHVPAHNNIVESWTIFDYNAGLFVESQPLDRRCYLKEIPPTMASMEQNFAVLSRRKDPLVASTAPIVSKHFGIVSQVSLAELTVEEMREECRGHQVFLVAQLDSEASESAPKDSFSPAPVNSLLNAHYGVRSCNFHGQCFWQTCKYGSDSCFWTVNCPATENNCDDMIHNSNFHHNGDPIECTACFNTFCNTNDYNCERDWNVNCHNGTSFDGPIRKCSNDETIGNDCGAKRCPIPSDEETWIGGDGIFDCVMDHDHPDYVLENHFCMFTCASGVPGGYIQCLNDGNTGTYATFYDDHTFCV